MHGRFPNIFKIKLTWNLCGFLVAGKNSGLKEEMVLLKEQLSRALLDKEVLEQEKAHISETLSKSELQKAETELEVNKCKSEEVALRDALVKLQSLNEGL